MEINRRHRARENLEPPVPLCIIYICDNLRSNFRMNSIKFARVVKKKSDFYFLYNAFRGLRLSELIQGQKDTLTFFK